MRDQIAAFARAAGRWVPDATASAVILLFMLAAVALTLGDTVVATADAWYRGLWMLLPFSMQMTLILVLSGVVSQTTFFRRVVGALAEVPRTVTQVLALSVAISSALAYLYWGLSLAMGPLIALQFAAAAERRGIPIDFPFLLATTFAAGSVWQFGLSSTAALQMATPGHFLEAQIGVLPLATTIGSVPAVMVTVVFPLALVLLARWLMPRDVQPLSAFPQAFALACEEPPAAVVAAGEGFSGWTERTALFPALLVAALAGWLAYHFAVKDAGVDLNSMITLLLLLGLLMQRTLAEFSRALARAVVAAWPVIVLYQVYGGVAGILQFTSVGTWFAGLFAELATPLSFPLLTALGGALIAIFVPSSGGQWIIQGFVTVTAAQQVGASPQLGLLALGVGDQMGNLLAPFWVVVAAGLARIDFRAIFGHILVYAMLWFAVAVSIFTFMR